VQKPASALIQMPLGQALASACPKTGFLATLSAAFVESFVELGQKTKISTKDATKVADKVEFWDRL